MEFFADEDTCIAFVVSIRWPDGVTCPRCGSQSVSYISTRHNWECKGCKKHFSVKVGTIFEDSALPLKKWLPAMWLIASAKNGISSYEIHRALGVTQKTAWFMLHRIRLAMQNGTLEKITGEVEADETFVGGLAKFMHKDKEEERIVGRGAVGKDIVMGLLDCGERKTAEAKKKKIGKHSKIRLKHVPERSGEVLQAEVRENVETGSLVFTDAAPAYVGLNPDYVHQFIDHAIKYAEGNVHTNGLENFWTLLKRTIKGTYVSCNSEHLFRFNEREGNDAHRFVAALASVSGRRLTYKQLTGKVEAE